MFKLLNWLLLLASLSHPSLALAATPPSEALVDVLKPINAQEALIAPFPPSNRADPRLGPLAYPLETQIDRYQEKMAPLQTHLLGMSKHLAANATQPLALQWFAANTAFGVLLWQRIEPYLNEEERAYEATRLMQVALANLNEAQQFWRERNDTQRPFRTQAYSVSDDDYTLRLKVLAAREALAELERLNTVSTEVFQGFTPQEGHP